MNLQHIEYFLMVSKELHFTRAAEKLGISQPTLSHQIKMLEQNVGYPLFNRIGKKIELTKVGRIVQQEATNIQQSLQSISSQIDSLAKMEIGEVKIAVLPGEMTDLISTLCIRFNQLYPTIRINILTTDQVEKAVLENQADFGISFHFNPVNLLQVMKLYDEEFYVISNKHAANPTVSFTSLFESPLILFPGMHQCRRILDQTSNEIGRQLEPIVETSSIESILNLVRHGIGRSVVSRTLFEFYKTEDLFFQYIENPALTREVTLVLKKNVFINFAVRKYIELLLMEIEKLRFHTEKESIASIQQAIS